MVCVDEQTNNFLSRKSSGFSRRLQQKLLDFRLNRQCKKHVISIQHPALQFLIEQSGREYIPALYSLKRIFWKKIKNAHTPYLL